MKSPGVSVWGEEFRDALSAGLRGHAGILRRLRRHEARWEAMAVELLDVAALAAQWETEGVLSDLVSLAVAVECQSVPLDESIVQASVELVEASARVTGIQVRPIGHRVPRPDHAGLGAMMRACGLDTLDRPSFHWKALTTYLTAVSSGEKDEIRTKAVLRRERIGVKVKHEALSAVRASSYLLEYRVNWSSALVLLDHAAQIEEGYWGATELEAFLAWVRELELDGEGFPMLPRSVNAALYEWSGERRFYLETLREVGYK